MKPAPFVYHRARSVTEAVHLLAQGGEDAKLLAGGQSLVAMMNLRLARPSTLVDINELPGMSYILQDNGGLRIGALTRHRQLELYPAVLDGFEALAAAARWVGHYPVRARGTFGGSIAHADAAAEWCILALLFEAEIVAVGPGGKRVVPIGDFFQGPFMTALEPDEVLTEVYLPRGYGHATLTEFARRHGDFAIVAAAAGYDIEDGVIRRPRVVLGGVAGRPVVRPAAAALLEGQHPSGELFRECGRVAADGLNPPEDVHGSAEYRRELAGVLVERALVETGARWLK